MTSIKATYPYNAARRYLELSNTGVRNIRLFLLISHPLTRRTSVLSICVCRFILLLREVYLPPEFWETVAWNVASRIVGNIGAPISVVQLRAAYEVDSGDTEEHELRVLHITDRP